MHNTNAIETTIYIIMIIATLAFVLGGCSAGAEVRGARVSLEIKPHEAFQTRQPDYDRAGLTNLIARVH